MFSHRNPAVKAVNGALARELSPKPRERIQAGDSGHNTNAAHLRQ
jgi:hypothetical protein